MSTSPDFWWKPRPSPVARLLFPLSWLYGLIAGRRMLAKPRAVSELPVVCIGNFVVGGTGKTPFAIELARLLRKEGLAPGFLLRGYGGTEKGPLLVDVGRHAAGDVGDEALLLAEHGPTIVAADRPAGAKLARQQPVDLLLMDDGFQNPSLAKDLSLALVDCATGFGNGLCLPAGPLRAPAHQQIIRADCLVLVGDGEAGGHAIHLAGRKGLPVMHAHLRPRPNEALEGVKLLAFAGIGRPQKFFSSLKGLGYWVKETREFADHHPYSEADAQALLTAAEQNGLQLVTTSKDMARLANAQGELFRWLTARTEVLEVAMQIDDASRLKALIRERLRTRTFSEGSHA